MSRRSQKKKSQSSMSMICGWCWLCSVLSCIPCVPFHVLSFSLYFNDHLFSSAWSLVWTRQVPRPLASCVSHRLVSSLVFSYLLPVSLWQIVTCVCCQLSHTCVLVNLVSCLYLLFGRNYYYYSKAPCFPILHPWKIHFGSTIAIGSPTLPHLKRKSLKSQEVHHFGFKRPF